MCQIIFLIHGIDSLEKSSFRIVSFIFHDIASQVLIIANENLKKCLYNITKFFNCGFIIKILSSNPQLKIFFMLYKHFFRFSIAIISTLDAISLKMKGTITRVDFSKESIPRIRKMIGHTHICGF